MHLAAPQLVNVSVAGTGMYWAIASYGLVLFVLVVGGIWGFRLGDGGGRGGGGSKRPPRREPTPPPDGHERPADFAAWESQLRAAGEKPAEPGQDDAPEREDKPLRIG